MYESVGKRIPRYDGVGHVTGRTMYVSDLKMPGMLTAKVLRSPYHKARILSIDTSAAKQLPGVFAVLTRADVSHNLFSMVPDHHLFAEEIIRHRGQIIAAVAAIDKKTALNALAAIKVEYEELEPVFDPEKALLPDAPQVRPEGNVHMFDGESPVRKIRRGDVDKGFAEADFIVEGKYWTPIQEHATLELCSSLTYLDESGKLVIHSKTQGIYFSLGDLTNLFNLPMSKIKFVGNTIGGGFGKGNSIHTDHIAGLLTLATGKPVRFALTREEELLYTVARMPWVFKIKDGVRKDGKIVARHMEIIHDCGAFTELGLYATEKNANLAAGANMIENLAIDSQMVYTNKPSSGSMRGFGVNIAQFAEQVHIDKIARACGKSPLEIRFINAFKEGDLAHVGNELTAVSTIETLQIMAEMAGIEVPEQYANMSSKGVEND